MKMQVRDFTFSRTVTAETESQAYQMFDELFFELAKEASPAESFNLESGDEYEIDE